MGNHVAFMLRGGAGSPWQPLKTHGKFCNTRDMKTAPRGAGRNAGSADEICTSRVAGGLGFEPRLTESESAVLPLNYPPNELRRSALLGTLPLNVTSE